MTLVTIKGTLGDGAEIRRRQVDLTLRRRWEKATRHCLSEEYPERCEIATASEHAPAKGVGGLELDCQPVTPCKKIEAQRGFLGHPCRSQDLA